MEKKADRRPRAQLLRADHDNEIVLRSLRIVAAPWNRPPFSVDGVALEDDTYNVLSEAPEFREVTEHPVRVMTQAFTVRPSVPGEVILKGGSPFRFLAIIHDLDQNPTWKEEWISTALRAIFREAEALKLQSLALPLIGTRFGSLNPERFMTLLKQVLRQMTLGSLKKLWLVVPNAAGHGFLELIGTDAEEEWLKPSR
jgi:hypothetical protein